jgi:Bacterial SH3 domain
MAEGRAHERESGRAEIWIILVLVLALGGAILWAVTRNGDEPLRDTALASTTTTGVSVPTLPPPRPYKVIDGVNVRAGPGTTFPILRQVEKGNEVTVVCRAEGQSVTTPQGATNLWLRVMLDPQIGYVSAAYVDTRGDLDDAAKIGVCTTT